MATINYLKYGLQRRGALLLGFLLFGVMLLIGFHLERQKVTQLHSQNSPQVVGAVLPHHLLVQNFMGDFYKVLTTEIQPERIILVSPNHFHFGIRYLQTTTHLADSHYDQMLDRDAIRFLATKGAVSLENKYYSKEHGIFVHYPFIEKFFPKAKIVPIIIKVGTPQVQLDALIRDLRTLDDKKTLILASVDFTHYVSEEIALSNDQRTVAYFERWSTYKQLQKNQKQIFEDLQRLSHSEKQKNLDAVAMDSPESLYVLLNFLPINGVREFQLWKRSSTESLLHITDSESNTSHIFGIFH